MNKNVQQRVVALASTATAFACLIGATWLLLPVVIESIQASAVDLSNYEGNTPIRDVVIGISTMILIGICAWMAIMSAGFVGIIAALKGLSLIVGRDAVDTFVNGLGDQWWFRILRRLV